MIRFILFLFLAGSLNAAELPTISVYFSPTGGCTRAVVAEIDHSQQSIYVQAYSFTSSPIAQALINAHKRGVDVQVILDKCNDSDKYSSATFLKNANIPTFIDHNHAIAHNKVMIIDNATVITGSFNFTKAAELHNAENLLIIHSKDISSKYTANWKAHLIHSK